MRTIVLATVAAAVLVAGGVEEHPIDVFDDEEQLDLGDTNDFAGNLDAQSLEDLGIDLQNLDMNAFSSMSAMDDDYEKLNTTRTIDEESDLAIDNLDELLSDSSEEYQFQAETSRLMDIIVNSLYSNKEIFLRELVSNAADAVEKVRFMAVSSPKILDSEKRLEIYVEVDKEASIIAVTDTGIGMTKTELIQNLGTVAKSGSMNFLEALETADVNLVGQFGVGFYSAYLVADKVVVTSKGNDDGQYVWTSSAAGTFQVAKDPRGNTLGRGTRIVLHLKEDAKKFLDTKLLKEILLKHSDFVTFPVFLKEKTSDGYKWTHVNVHKPIWLRPKEEITDSDYKKFYRLITGERQDPIMWNHFHAEGDIDFKAIVYVPPTKAAFAHEEKQAPFRIYNRRVLVEDRADVFPSYMKQFSGVVDSDDFPLKVDRETLSDSRIMSIIRNKIVRKTFDMLIKFAKESDKAIAKQIKGDPAEAKKTPYELFWENMGYNLLMGCVDDHKNIDKIQKLLRFKTSKSSGRVTSLEDYKARRKEGQDKVFYVIASSEALADQHPAMGLFKKKDIEVIRLVKDHMLTNCFDRLPGEQFVAIDSSKDFQFEESEEEKNRTKAVKKYLKDFTQWITDTVRKNENLKLIDRVEIASVPLTVPAAIESRKGASSEYLLRMSPWFEEEMYSWMFQKTLQLNPDHPLVKLLFQNYQSSKVAEMEEVVADLAESALVQSGYQLSNPGKMVERMHEEMARSMGATGKDLENLDPLEVPDEFFKEEPEVSPSKDEEVLDWDEEDDVVPEEGQEEKDEL